MGMKRRKKPVTIEQAKQQARKVLSHSRGEIDHDHEEVLRMAAVYEQALVDYGGSAKGSAYRSFGHVYRKTGNAYRTIARACKFAKELGVEPETYIRAQFHYFDKNFKKAPKIYHLASHQTKVPAKARVEEYIASKAAPKTIVGPVIKAPTIPATVKDRHSERQLKMFMRNYDLTEADVFRKFAQGRDAYLYFDRNWLLKNTTYMTLKNAGEV